MFSVIAKRFLKRPITENDIFSVIGTTFNELSWLDKNDMKDIRLMLQQQFADGDKTVEAVWRDLISQSIKSIVVENTFERQRKKLLEQTLTSVRWISLYNVFCPSFADKPDLLEGMIDDVPAFANQTQNKWVTTLSYFWAIHITSLSIYALIGESCFGLKSNDKPLLDFRLFYEQDLKSRFLLASALQKAKYLRDGLSDVLTDSISERVLPYWAINDDFFQRFSMSICNREPHETFCREWEELSKRYNDEVAMIIMKQKGM
jgi:hypothetical protein